ncbi:hypothetical protein HDV00_001635 [Rhizophlyctis rosea]|nr:hypothetical protein HDV00_001635 [Rhizophlyctis rosea]
MTVTTPPSPPSTKPLPAALLQLLHTGDGADVTITIGYEKFHAHKAIIIARSEYFSAMLSGSDGKTFWREAATQEIDLSDTPVTVDGFKAVLQCMYSDTLPELTTVNFVINLYKALDYLLIRRGITDLSDAFVQRFESLTWQTKQDWFSNIELASLNPLNEAIIPLLSKYLRDDPEALAPSGQAANYGGKGYALPEHFSEYMQNCAMIIRDASTLVKVVEGAYIEKYLEQNVYGNCGCTLNLITFVDCWMKVHPEEASNVPPEVFKTLIDICMRTFTPKRPAIR